MGWCCRDGPGVHAGSGGTGELWTGKSGKTTSVSRLSRCERFRTLGCAVCSGTNKRIQRVTDAVVTRKSWIHLW